MAARSRFDYERWRTEFSNFASGKFAGEVIEGWFPLNKSREDEHGQVVKLDGTLSSNIGKLGQPWSYQNVVRPFRNSGQIDGAVYLLKSERRCMLVMFPPIEEAVAPEGLVQPKTNDWKAHKQRVSSTMLKHCLIVYGATNGPTDTASVCGESEADSTPMSEFSAPGTPGIADDIENSTHLILGNLVVQHAVMAKSFFTLSDARVKRNITPLQLAYPDLQSRVQRLGTYVYQHADFIETDEQQYIGLLAQEVQNVFPEAVTQRPDGFLAVNYIQLIPVLVSALNDVFERLSIVESVHNRPGPADRQTASPVPTSGRRVSIETPTVRIPATTTTTSTPPQSGSQSPVTPPAGSASPTTPTSQTPVVRRNSGSRTPQDRRTISNSAKRRGTPELQEACRLGYEAAFDNIVTHRASESDTDDGCCPALIRKRAPTGLSQTAQKQDAHEWEVEYTHKHWPYVERAGVKRRTHKCVQCGKCPLCLPKCIQAAAASAE
eukprot:TRINITY_DN927_c0_g1_i1.p1 TRINITY_DN927_c0_g1~~TRINITY_DN927_c0_g1_i1.p1  ORF type:complete len:508 (-),score=66.66 TRINITY_DN927_c0_g1_i1:1172-2647(-)